MYVRSTHACVVCRCVTSPVFSRVSACVTLRPGDRTEGMSERMVISVSRGPARGSMIKTLNQIPRSNITAESCNFNFFRPADTNKLDMTPFNINQPLQEIPVWRRSCLCNKKEFRANVAWSCSISHYSIGQ